MVDKYNADILRVAVAQICQTIGYNNAQSAPVELLQDVLHRFLMEFCRDLRRKTEHANRIESNLKDAYLSMKSLNIDIQELLGYISNVEPVPFSFEVPNYPARKDCKLNFLKPGSKEVLTRPVHIYEYLPPILHPDSHQSAATSTYNNNSSLEEGDTMLETSSEVIAECPKTESDGAATLAKSGSIDMNFVKLPSRTFDDDGRPTREISSVVMTTGGFISPAIEGKLADARIPDIIDEFHGLDAPPPPPPPPLPLATHVPPLAPTLDSNVKDADVINISSSKLKHVLPPGDAPFPQDEKSKRRGDYQAKGRQSASGTFLKQSKKARKKMANEQQQQQLSGVGEVDLITKKTQDKNHRKAIKMLHKLNKTAKNNKSQNAQLNDFAHRLNEHITPATLATYPPSSLERIQLEKMLKKQAKLRQKLLKQQQQQQQQQQQEVPKTQAHENAALVQHESDDKFLTKTKQTENEFNIGTLERNKVFNAEGMQLLTSEPALSGVSQGDDQQQPRAQHETSIDLKLSNEPDRTKLNIFKKISKQKTPKTLSPNEHAASACPPPPVINLPLGTTITPTPALVPLGAAELRNESSIFNTTGGAIGLADAGMKLYSNADAAAAAAGVAMLNAATDLNKPKKRGRKPGSKNQIKNPLNAFAGLAAANSSKKQKQSKALNAGAFDATLEAISLMQQPQQFPGALNFPTGALSDAGLLKLHDQVTTPPVKEKKERKKYKSKYNPLGLSSCDMAMTEAPVANSMLAHQVAPMLYPPAAAHKSHDAIGGDMMLLSPSTMKLKSPPNQKKPSPQKVSPSLVGHGAFMSPQPNMLPMLPLYPFPPRPGLIPSAPGFFSPAGMPNFSSAGNNSGAASNLLMPTFLPFANFNPAGSLTNNEHKHISSLSSPKELQHDERNFCKVAPLIPDSMKLIPLNEQHTQVHIHANASQDKSQAQAFPAINTADSSNCKGGDGGMAKFEQDSLGSMKLQKIKANKLTGIGAGLPGKKLLLPSTASGNADDPIEVSDDSLSDSPAHKATTQADIKLESSAPNPTLQGFHGNLIQPGHLSNMALPTLRDNMLMPNAFQNLVQQKLKKPTNKFLANTNKSPTTTLSSATVTPPFTLDLKGKEKLCLAGGADLIPLMRTDSSVTAYPTMMNAADGGLMAQSISTFETSHNPSSSTYQLFEGVTITPTSTNMPSSSNACMDMKRRKEHKKLKKLKEGKIKKKKDKKDKSRSKDRSGSGEKYFQKVDKLTKDLEKKLKKERKRERQRLLLNSGMPPLDLPAVVTIPTATCGFGSSQPAVLSEPNPDQVVINTQIHPAPKAMAMPSPNQLPKITLKISGNNSKSSTPVHFDELHDMTEGQAQPQPPPPSQEQAVEQVKRSQSPELARFSPLVTRPPKAKQNEAQSAAATPVAIPSGSLNTANVSCNNDAQTTISAAGTTTSSNIWPAGGTLSASSVLLPQQLLQTAANQQKMPSGGSLGSAGGAANISSATSANNTKRENTPPTLPQVPESNRPSSYVDSDGNTIWICPACGKVDDGSPMIGCDGCDAWYHWVCVGIFVAPKDNEDWFCRVCITRKKVHVNDKKRKRNKKK